MEVVEIVEGDDPEPEALEHLLRQEKTTQDLEAYLPKVPLETDDITVSIDECAICMGHEGQYARILKCGHIFCETCLFEWFRKGALRCPLCNQSVVFVGPDGEVSVSSSSRYTN